jgi:peptide/nickel transport system permease protein
MLGSTVTYILRRVLYMLVTLLIISVIAFIVIELPPGDYVTSYVQALRARGVDINILQEQALRERYGLDLPWYHRYAKWFTNLTRGELGYSYSYAQPVATLIAERLPITVIISVTTILFSWSLALPIAIYSAVRKYTVGDYVVSTLGFIGLSIPNFFLAILLMYVGFQFFGVSIGGLFSREYLLAPWSIGKVMDMLSRIWVPVVVIGTAGTAGTIRVLRASLLDELGKDYVRTARAKGLSELRILLVHPLRVAINPLISTIGWLLPTVISGEVITSQVLALPTTGPLLLGALQNQDMYLAGSFVFILSLLTVIGTLISDLLLVWIDPRIRYD